MMPALELCRAMRCLSAAALPSLLVIKMVLARAGCDAARGAFHAEADTHCRRAVGNRPKRCLAGARAVSNIKSIIQEQGVAPILLDGVAAALHAVFVHQDHDILQV